MRKTQDERAFENYLRGRYGPDIKIRWWQDKDTGERRPTFIDPDGRWNLTGTRLPWQEWAAFKAGRDSVATGDGESTVVPE